MSEARTVELSFTGTRKFQTGDERMCSHYEEVKDPQALREVFQVEPPAQMGKADLWPGYQGLLIRRPGLQVRSCSTLSHS